MTNKKFSFPNNWQSVIFKVYKHTGKSNNDKRYPKVLTKIAAKIKFQILSVTGAVFAQASWRCVDYTLLCNVCISLQNSPCVCVENIPVG